MSVSDSSSGSPETRGPESVTGEPRWCVEWGIVSGLLIAWSFLRVPVPGVNEPHYLTKAKHFWNPEWCANDFFLNSTNPHLVFYTCCGWLTQFLSLPETAVVLRCVGLIALAAGWTCLLRTLSQVRWASALTLCLFLGFHSLGNWSGEWLVGGIESKVFAYACLFGSIGLFLQRRFVLNGLLAGLAFSFHPVVGAWGILCAAIAVLFQMLCTRRADRWLHREDAVPVLLASVVLLVATLPGLWPALNTLSSGSAAESAKADLLQVASRLKHHLDPMTFPKADYRYFGLLITALGFLWWQSRTTRENHQSVSNWWRWFVIASLCVAFCGVLLGWGPRPMQEMPGYAWRIKLLKLYPFRLADLLVPIALSVAILQAVWQQLGDRRGRTNAAVIAAAIYLGSIWMPGPDQNPGSLAADIRSEWGVVCDWIKQNTESDAMVYAINEQWALRWSSERAEYVNYKDCPQDAAGMVEWNERLWVIHRWKLKCFEDGQVSTEELQELGARTGIDWFVASKFGPITAEPSFEHGRFKIYRIEK